MLNAKMHRAWGTGTNTEYVGSAIIDSALKETGFCVLEAVDLSEHLRACYLHLDGVILEFGGRDKKYDDLSYAYGQMVKAQENGELGWAFYLCAK